MLSEFHEGHRKEKIDLIVFYVITPKLLYTELHSESWVRGLRNEEGKLKE